MAWQIEFEGHTLREDEVTVGDVTIVGQVVGDDSWDSMTANHSPKVLAAWCVVALMRGGFDLDAAIRRVNSTRIVGVLEALKPMNEHSDKSKLSEEQIEQAQAKLAVLRDNMRAAGQG